MFNGLEHQATEFRRVSCHGSTNGDSCADGDKAHFEMVYYHWGGHYNHWHNSLVFHSWWSSPILDWATSNGVFPYCSPISILY